MPTTRSSTGKLNLKQSIRKKHNTDPANMTSAQRMQLAKNMTTPYTSLADFGELQNNKPNPDASMGSRTASPTQSEIANQLRKQASERNKQGYQYPIERKPRLKTSNSYESNPGHQYSHSINLTSESNIHDNLANILLQGNKTSGKGKQTKRKPTKRKPIKRKPTKRKPSKSKPKKRTKRRRNKQRGGT